MEIIIRRKNGAAAIIVCIVSRFQIRRDPSLWTFLTAKMGAKYRWDEETGKISPRHFLNSEGIFSLTFFGREFSLCQGEEEGGYPLADGEGRMTIFSDTFCHIFRRRRRTQNSDFSNVAAAGGKYCPSNNRRTPRKGLCKKSPFQLMAPAINFMLINFSSGEKYVFFFFLWSLTSFVIFLTLATFPPQDDEKRHRHFFGFLVTQPSH